MSLCCDNTSLYDRTCIDCPASFCRFFVISGLFFVSFCLEVVYCHGLQCSYYMYALRSLALYQKVAQPLRNRETTG